MARSRSKTREKVSAKRWREEVRGGSEYLRVPSGLTMFSSKPGTYRLDFMSFRAGKGNPRAEEGEPYFERTIWIHKEVGPNNEWHLCLARTFKKPCPICEHRAKLSADPEADEALIKSLAPKSRQLWLVKDLQNDPDGVMLWDVSTALFGEMLKDKINNSDEEDGYDFFADPTEGLTMRLALQQSDRGKWTETGDIEFRARKRQYDSEIVDEMPCLDELLVPTPYDKLKRLFLQTDEDDEVDEKLAKSERRPEEKSKQRPTKEKDEREVSVGDDVWYKGKKCEVVHVSGDGTSLTLEDEDEVFHKAVGVDDLEDPPSRSKQRPRPEPREDDDEPEPEKLSKSKKKPAADEDDDWDDWDDEPEEKPAKKKSKPVEDDEPEQKPSKSKKKPAVDEDDWDDWD